MPPQEPLGDQQGNIRELPVSHMEHGVVNGPNLNAEAKEVTIAGPAEGNRPFHVAQGTFYVEPKSIKMIIKLDKYQ